MLRLRTSPFLFATTFPHPRVQFPVTSLPPSLERGSRPHSNDPPLGRVTESRLKNSPSAPPSTGPVSSEADERIENIQSRVRQWSERNTIALRRRADTLVARLAVSFTRLGGEINKVTGYDEIEELKRQVVSQGTSSFTLPIWRSFLGVSLTCIRGSHFCL
jgi:She9 / Mdm33 family